MRDATVHISFQRRRTILGPLNVLEVRHGAFGKHAAGVFEIEFEHVGVSELPEPGLLDGYVFGVLMFAMGGADRLVVHGEVSSAAIRNAMMFGEAWHCWRPDLYRPVEVVAEQTLHVGVGVPTRSGGDSDSAVAAFSGRVDSVFTALRHAGGLLGSAGFRLEKLCLVHGFDVRLDNTRDFTELMSRTSGLVKQLGLEVHVVKTNIKELSPQDWEHSFGAQLACILHQFAPEFRYGLVASGDSYFEHPLIEWGSTPATDHLLSGSCFTTVHDGAGYSRTEKIQAVSSNKAALDALKVCWEGNDQGRNCGKCAKCVRTKINLVSAGVGSSKCFDEGLSEDEVRDVSLSARHTVRGLTSALRYADAQGISDSRLEVLRDRPTVFAALLPTFRRRAR